MAICIFNIWLTETLPVVLLDTNNQNQGEAPERSQVLIQSLGIRNVSVHWGAPGCFLSLLI